MISIFISRVSFLDVIGLRQWRRGGDGENEVEGQDVKQPDDDQENVGRSRIALASSSLRWSSSCGDTGSEVGELRLALGSIRLWLLPSPSICAARCLAKAPLLLTRKRVIRFLLVLRGRAIQLGHDRQTLP